MNETQPNWAIPETERYRRQVRIGNRLVPLAGVLLIACLIAVKGRSHRHSMPATRAAATAPVAAFTGVDPENQLFRLSTFLGRHKILMVFCGDTEKPLEASSAQWVRRCEAPLKVQDTVVVYVTTQLPQHIRRSALQLHEREYLVCDVGGEIYRQWNTDDATDSITPSVHVVGRDGWVHAVIRPHAHTGFQEIPCHRLTL